MKYTELQIIKHALQYYLKRPGADQKDLDKETRLLKEIEDEIIHMKIDYRIELTDYEKKRYESRGI